MTQDVIILGGGIVGVTIGFFLATAGLKPLIIEPHKIGGGTTSASFAWANASSKTDDAAYHHLNAGGVAGYRALAKDYGNDRLGIRAAGALHIVAKDDATGLNTMRRDQQILDGFGYPAQIIDTTTLQAREPNLTFNTPYQALHLPKDMIIDAPLFAQTLAGMLAGMGGRVLHQIPQALLMDDTGRVTGVQTDQNSYHAANVILAAGKDTGQVLADLTGYAPFASRFPLKQVPGLLLEIPDLKGPLPYHVITTSTTSEVHMLPMPGGGLKIGSDDIDAMIWEDHGQASRRAAGRALLDRAQRFLPGLPARVDLDTCRLNIGTRAYPEDGKSLIGPLPGSEGLYICATHSGITLAPIIGRLMAHWLTTGTRPQQLAPYCLTRFPGFSSAQ